MVFKPGTNNLERIWVRLTTSATCSLRRRAQYLRRSSGIYVQNCQYERGVIKGTHLGRLGLLTLRRTSINALSFSGLSAT